VAAEDELEAGSSRMPLWQKLLRAAILARAIPRRTALEPERPSIRRGVGGCLMRFVLLIVFLVVAVFVFGGALLQGW